MGISEINKQKNVVIHCLLLIFHSNLITSEVLLSNNILWRNSWKMPIENKISEEKLSNSEWSVNLNLFYFKHDLMLIQSHKHK